MQILINFTNLNDSADGVRVYRATSPIDINNLPAALTTLAGTANSFTDSAVVKNQTYYYVFEIFKGADRVLSANVPATAAPYSGPGPQLLKAGDLSAGFYGVVSPTDFMTWDAFITWAGVTPSAKPANAPQEWLKFAYKGKTLFTPRQPIGLTTWNAVYGAGLVYGVAGPGPREYNTAAAVNQLRTISVAGVSFKARLMTSVPPGFDLTQQLSSVNTPGMAGYGGSSQMSDSQDCILDLTGSEWNDLMYRLLSWTPPSQRGRNWDALDVTLSTSLSPTYTGMISDHMFQEMTSAKVNITRGRVTAIDTYTPGSLNTIAPTTATYWRPVLEMI